MSDLPPEQENGSDPSPMDGNPLHLHNRSQIEKRIASQEARKLKAREEKHHTIWFGLGMFGLVGWSIAIPSVAGALIGVWIDSRWPSRYSWSLMLLIGGIALGCFNAWKWIHKEGKLEK